MKKYCEFPWTGKNVKLWNDFERCCCKMPFAPREKDQARLSQIKSAFLNGEQHPACNACWSEEDVGGKSFRILQSPVLPTEQKINFLSSQEQTLEYVDLEFGYTCNMYCLSCGPYASTTWQQIAKIYPWEEKGINEESLNKFLSLVQDNNKSLKRINLYGGDPSVDPMYYRFIDRFLSMEVPQCELGIVTNGNYSENFLIKFEDSLRRLIDAGRKLFITFSLDGVGEEGEFIRGGLRMDRFTRNIKSVISFGLRPRLQVSVSILNIENNIDIIKWLEEENILNDVDVHFNKVSMPEDLSVNILGNKIRDFLPNGFDELQTTRPKYHRGITNFLGSEINSMAAPNLDKIKRCIKRLDDYVDITRLPLPKYYQNFRIRLSNLVNESVS